MINRNSALIWTAVFLISGVVGVGYIALAIQSGGI